MKIRKTIPLNSGNECQLIKIQRDFIPNYYLLAFPKHQGEPSINEVAEMLKIGIEQAKNISFEILGDQEAYSIIYSGYSARREKGWHIHIILLGNRWKKAWLYFVLTFKNVGQALGLRKDDSPKIK